MNSSTPKLRIAALSHIESESLNDQLIPCAAARGHVIERVVPSQMSLSDLDTDPFLQGLLDYDLVYYRSGLEPVGAWLLESWLHKHGKRLLNGVYREHPFITRKKYQIARAAEVGVVMPKTVHHSADEYEQLVATLGAPFIVKADVSAQGRDVHRIDSREQFAEIVTLRKEKQWLYQEYVPHRCDYRVNMLMDTPVTVYRRVPAENDFRANVSRGGHMEAVDPEKTATLFGLASSLGQLFKLDLSGIDFLEGDDGQLYFCEINTNPGWQGALTDGTPVDISEQVITYFEEEATRQRS